MDVLVLLDFLFDFKSGQPENFAESSECHYLQCNNIQKKKKNKYQKALGRAHYARRDAQPGKSTLLSIYQKFTSRFLERIKNKKKDLSSFKYVILLLLCHVWRLCRDHPHSQAAVRAERAVITCHWKHDGVDACVPARATCCNWSKTPHLVTQQPSHCRHGNVVSLKVESCRQCGAGEVKRTSCPGRCWAGPLTACAVRKTTNLLLVRYSRLEVMNLMWPSFTHAHTSHGVTIMSNAVGSKFVRLRTLVIWFILMKFWIWSAFYSLFI